MKRSIRSSPKQGKGSKHRPTDWKKFRANFDSIFKKKDASASHK